MSDSYAQEKEEKVIELKTPSDHVVLSAVAVVGTIGACATWVGLALTPVN